MLLARESTAKNTFGDSLNISSALFAQGVLRPSLQYKHEADGSIYIGNFKTGLIRVRDGNKVKRFLPPSPYSDRFIKSLATDKAETSPSRILWTRAVLRALVA